MHKPAQFVELQPRPTKRGQTPRIGQAARLPHFIGGPADAAAKLAELQILIVGVGSVGARIAVHLARFGIATLWLIDPKYYKAESVLTHEMDPSDVGKSKAMATGRRCKAISPATRVFAFTGAAEDLPLDAFADADLVVLATDNLAAEIDVGQRCVRFGKPLVQASVHGETLIAQVRVFSNANVRCPCPACAYGAVEWRMLNEQVRFSCDGFLQTAVRPQTSNPFTVSTSSTCSTGADLGVNQILRLALTLGQPVLDTCVEHCGFTNRCVTTRLVRNTNCPVDHTQCQLATTDKPLAETTPAELLNLAAFSAEAGPVSFTVDGFNWIVSGVCRCPTPKPVCRFLPMRRKQTGHCSKCNSSILSQPLYAHRTVAAALLGDALEKSLQKLGAAKARCVLVGNGDKSILFREPDPQLLPS